MWTTTQGQIVHNLSLSQILTYVIIVGHLISYDSKNKYIPEDTQKDVEESIE